MSLFCNDESRRNMKILVIHPNDPTTDDLCVIYKDVPNATVVRGGVHKEHVRELIEEHDRIFMMGHGSTDGLFACGEFFGGGFVIDEDTVPLLRNKECVFIWCFASIFVIKHDLSGFFTGMFISEPVEAEMFLRNPSASAKDITDSNKKFAELMHSKVAAPLCDLVVHVKSEYHAFGEDRNCDVVRYNCSKIGLAGTKHGTDVATTESDCSDRRAGESSGGRTLVIHPGHSDSDFAREISDWPDVTVATGDMSKLAVENLIAAHDRIVMIGSGDAQGLYGEMQFGDKQRYGDCHWVVDSRAVPALREKECIFLWSESNMFVINNGLRGVYVGDFVTSQSNCSSFLDHPLPAEETVRESNEALAALMATLTGASGSMRELFAVSKEKYAELAEGNPVVAFNAPNLLYYDGIWPSL